MSDKLGWFCVKCGAKEDTEWKLSWEIGRRLEGKKKKKFGNVWSAVTAVTVSTMSVGVKDMDIYGDHDLKIRLSARPCRNCGVVLFQEVTEGPNGETEEDKYETS
jgi:hypothetical protein